MKAIIAVIGQDEVGIVARFSTKCAEYNANVIEVNQTVMQEYFAMIMLADISKLNTDFREFSDSLIAAGKEIGMEVHVMHEDIFNSMHRI